MGVNEAKRHFNEVKSIRRWRIEQVVLATVERVMPQFGQTEQTFLLGDDSVNFIPPLLWEIATDVVALQVTPSTKCICEKVSDLNAERLRQVIVLENVFNRLPRSPLLSLRE